MPLSWDRNIALVLLQKLQDAEAILGFDTIDSHTDRLESTSWSKKGKKNRNN